MLYDDCNGIGGPVMGPFAWIIAFKFHSNPKREDYSYFIEEDTEA